MSCATVIADLPVAPSHNPMVKQEIDNEYLDEARAAFKVKDE
jgi:hypothetical protein